jgi:Kef-type K+ transport system membrane component KefB
MVPRGEVGIVVANLGLATGLMVGTLYSAVMAAVILTTIVAPFLLSWAIPRALDERKAAHAHRRPDDGPGEPTAITTEPPTGA